MVESKRYIKTNSRPPSTAADLLIMETHYDILKIAPFWRDNL
jgi:hypothetical protein